MKKINLISGSSFFTEDHFVVDSELFGKDIVLFTFTEKEFINRSVILKPCVECPDSKAIMYGSSKSNTMQKYYDKDNATGKKQFICRPDFHIVADKDKSM